MICKQDGAIVSGSMSVDTHLGNARIMTTHSGSAGMLRDGRVIVERADVLDLARALSVWHASNVREGAPGAVLDGIPFGLAEVTRAPTHLIDQATGKPYCEGARWCRGADEPTTVDRRLADCTRCIAASPVAPFVECADCAAKPGSPTLCAECLDRRRSWLRARGAVPPAEAPAEERTADVLKRVYACKRCGADNQNIYFDGDRQIGCARCAPHPHPLTLGRMDAASKRIFTDAALKERDRMASFGAHAAPPVEMDASVPNTAPLGREVYTRVVAMLGDVEVIPGVELRRDETLEAMLPTVRACAENAIGTIRRAIATLDDKRPVMVHAQRLAQQTERFITTRLPGRRYFIEVGNDREGWIQVCTPAADQAPAPVTARGHRWGRDEGGGPKCLDCGVWEAHASRSVCHGLAVE